MNLQETILKAGIENCMFLVPMRPVQIVPGLIAFTSSDDPEIVVPAKINEDRYKVEKNYKITLKSTYEQFGQNHYYISDLELLIKKRTVQFFIREKLD